MVDGGRRTPLKGFSYKGKRYLIVPHKDRKTRSGKVKKSGMRGGKPFVINKGGNLILVKRSGKKRYSLIVLGLLIRSTQYKRKTLDWTDQESTFIPKTYRAEFIKSMTQAARTAR